MRSLAMVIRSAYFGVQKRRRYAKCVGVNRSAFVNMLATVKPMTITICNKTLLKNKISVIHENEINDIVYCYTLAVLGLIGTYLPTQRD